MTKTTHLRSNDSSPNSVFQYLSLSFLCKYFHKEIICELAVMQDQNDIWLCVPSLRHDNPLMCCCYSFVMNKLLTVFVSSAAFLTVWIDLLIYSLLRKGPPPVPLCASDESIFNWYIYILGKLLAFLLSRILKYLVLCIIACLFRIVELKSSLFFLIIADTRLSSLLFWSRPILQKCSTKLIYLEMKELASILVYILLYILEVGQVRQQFDFTAILKCASWIVQNSKFLLNDLHE